MKDNLLIKTMLGGVFILLLVNIICSNISFLPKNAYAQTGIGNIACSADGQYVYVLIRDTLHISENYGNDFSAKSSHKTFNIR